MQIRSAITIIAAVAIAGYALAGCGTIRAPLSYEVPHDCVHDAVSTLCGQ
jgi:hypothetical protein